MSWAAGDTLPECRFTLTRADLVAYAAASGDQNPIHQDPDVARSVGLPDVIAHGMLTLGLVGAAVEGWAGGPGRVLELGAKFTKPVVVPADTDVELVVAGTVRAVDDDRVTVALTVTCGGDKVLGNPTAVLCA